MKVLRNEIKNKTISGAYLFCGEETYLLKKYEDAVIKACISGFPEMNLTVLEGKRVPAQQIVEAAETLPFMNDNRIVIVRASELFSIGRKDDSIIIADYLNGYNNDTCILIFEETAIDKRGKAYKTIKTYGKIVEFNPLTENELLVWHTGLLKKENLSASTKDSLYLFRICGGDMETILRETEKLIAFKKEGKISREDIDSLCTKTSEARVFDLIDALAEKNVKTALFVYNELLAMKETPVKILALMSRQFRLILKTSLLNKKGNGNDRIVNLLEEKPFVVKIALSQARNFSIKTLENAVLDTVSCDTGIKSGLEDAKLAVEMLIIKYAN